MRVLHLGKYYPPVNGGIETVTCDLSEGLNAIGIRSDVICSDIAPPVAVEKMEDSCNVMRMPTWFTAASTPISPAMVVRLRRIVHRYDIVHVHMPNPMAGLALLASGFGGKVVLHWHSDVVKQKNLMKLYLPLQNWLMRRADAIIATSPLYIDSSPFLSQWRNKVRVIPLGINESHLKADSRILDSLRSRYAGRRIVFSLGRMTYYKGFKYLVNAALHMPDDVVVIIGGSGELSGDLQAQVTSLGLSGKVEISGKVPTAELGAYYALADVFCLPSIARSEAFGIVLLEAMACGKPLVACDIPGSGVSWVNRNGYSGLNISPEDDKKLATAIMLLLDDKELREKFGLQARKRFEDYFTADHMVRGTRKLYDELL